MTEKWAEMSPGMGGEVSFKYPTCGECIYHIDATDEQFPLCAQDQETYALRDSRVEQPMCHLGVEKSK